MLRILVADEAELILVLQESYLKRAGCEVLTAGSSAEILDRARECRPDLVVASVVAGGDGAIEGCRRIKADPALAGARVVLLAAEGHEEVCRAAGADAVVRLPMDREDLLAAFRRCIEVRERETGRRALSTRVEVFGKKPDSVAYTKDISVDGLFLKSKESFAVGDRLQLVFALPDDFQATIRADAEVVRVVSPIATPP